MNWDNVEKIRSAQKEAKQRYNEEQIATQDAIDKAMQSNTFKQLELPHLNNIEAMIFKMRSELIDYIVAHGLVDGLIFDGELQPVENGKIVITKDMIEAITAKMGYFTEDMITRFLEDYLPENNYVQDANYVHTDNNYTLSEKEKLANIENDAEVNKIIDMVFNGVSVLDNGTRVATITITKEDIKRWYEENENTNCFTDAEKTKLAGIDDGAEVNEVDDVLVNNRSVLDGKKQAIISKEIIKQAYEANDDTNAFTDAEKKKLAEIEETYVPYEGASKEVDLNGQVIKNAAIFETTALGSAGAPKIVVSPERISHNNANGNYAETNVYFSNDEVSLVNETADSIPFFAPVNVGEPTKDTHAVTKRYVDEEAGKVDDVQLNSKSIVKDKIANLTNADIKKAYEANDDTNAFTDAEKQKLADLDETYVPFTGSAKDVNLNGKTVTNVKTPTNDSDVAIKSYVDTSVIKTYDLIVDTSVKTAIYKNRSVFIKLTPNITYKRPTATIKTDITGARWVKFDATGSPIDKPYFAVDYKTDCIVGFQIIAVTNMNTTLRIFARDVQGVLAINSLTIETPYIEIDTSTAGELALYNGDTLAKVKVETPTEDTHATTKKYVDDAISSADKIKIFTKETDAFFNLKINNSNPSLFEGMNQLALGFTLELTYSDNTTENVPLTLIGISTLSSQGSITGDRSFDYYFTDEAVTTYNNLIQAVHVFNNVALSISTLQIVIDQSKNTEKIVTDVNLVASSDTTPITLEVASGPKVRDVQLDGVSLVESDGVANLSNKFVPYEGAKQEVNLNAQRMTNVANPTENSDVATKQYVDDNAGGAGIVEAKTVEEIDFITLTNTSGDNLALTTDYTCKYIEITYENPSLSAGSAKDNWTLYKDYGIYLYPMVTQDTLPMREFIGRNPYRGSMSNYAVKVSGALSNYYIYPINDKIACSDNTLVRIPVRATANAFANYADVKSALTIKFWHYVK